MMNKRKPRQPIVDCRRDAGAGRGLCLGRAPQRRPLMRVRLVLYISILSLALLVVGFPALAQSGSFDLSWWTVDGGGGTSTGNGYTLSGTIGQPDTGVMAGGSYSLAGGFWGGGGLTAGAYDIYLPLVRR